MPRINTRKVEMNDVPRFCPNCGAANATAGLRCTICGHQFASADTVAGLWGDSAQNAKNGGEDFETLYSDAASDAAAQSSESVSETMATRPFTPVSDPWSSAGGRLGADPSTGKAFVPPIGGSKEEATSGPPSWLLGLVGVLLILGVAAAAFWLVGRPLLADEVSDSAAEGIEDAVAQVTIPAQLEAGTLVVTETDVNRVIREHQDRFEPVRNIRVQIRRSGIETRFTVFGVSTTLTGSIGVEDGRIVIIEPQLSGVARRMVDLDDITPRAEDAINDLLARNNLTATAVTLADDTLTITTEPASP